MKLGLIGKKLSHSFSANYILNKYHSLPGLEYKNYEFGCIEEVKDFLKNTDVFGCNVTIPYKESILPYLDELTKEARAIGAVNCIVNVNGKWKGHNTDAEGFRKSLLPFYKNTWKKALVLGTGGSAKAVTYALKFFDIHAAWITRRKPFPDYPEVFLYNELNENIIQQTDLIINCTPAGMFPDVDSMPPFPVEFISEKHFVVDLIYNPEETLFLRKSREKKAQTLNGLNMLYFQADESMRFWMEHCQDMQIQY